MRVNQKNNFIGEKPKMTYITEGKNLLTLYSINLKKKKKILIITTKILHRV